MTTARRALAVLALAGLLVPFAVLTASTATAETLVSGVTLDSRGDDGTGAGRVLAAIAPAYTITPTTAGSTTTLTARDQWGTVVSPTISLTPPTGATELAVGTWQTATAATTELAGLSVNSTTCPSHGTLAVHDVGYAGGALTSLAATYSFACDGAPGTAYGELRYQSSMGITNASARTSLTGWFAQVGTPSQTDSLVVANTGTLPLTPGTAFLTGTSPQDFQVVTDGCAGTTVPVGGTCKVAVRTVPTVAGTRTAVLAVPDGTARGARTAALTAEAWLTPYAPSNLSAVAATDGIALDWRPPTQSSATGVTEYQLLRGSSADDLALLATIPGNSFGHYADVVSATTQPGTTYTYAVRAVNSAGAGPMSSTATAVTPDAAFVPTATGLVVHEPGAGVFPSGATVHRDRAVGDVVSAVAGSPYYAPGVLSVAGWASGGSRTGVDITPPLGKRFTNGTYQVGLTNDETHAMAYVVVAGSACYAESGTLQVHRVAVDTANVPQAVSFDLTYRCALNAPMSRLYARVGDDTPFSAVDVSDVAAGPVVVGSPTTVHSVFTNVGTQDVTVTGVTLTGGAGTWAVSGGGCPGAVLAPSVSCTTDLSVTPGAAGATTGSLRYDHTAASATTTRSLSATGTEPPLEVGWATANRAAGKVTLAWNDAAYGSSREATSWEVWRGDSADTLSLLATTSAKQWTDPDTSDTLRFYSIRPLNVAGAGPGHPLTVDARTIPPALAGSATATTVLLDWTPSSTVSPDPVTGYRVFRGTSAGSLVAVGDTTALRWTGAAPAKGQTSWYAVAPLMGTTEGVRSQAVAVTGTGQQLLTTSDGSLAGTLRVRSVTDGRSVPFTGPGFKKYPEGAAVSPNGTRVAYVVEDRGYGEPYVSYDVVVRSTDGTGTPTTLVSDARPKSELAWSPDGTWLAYTAASDDRTTTYLHVLPTAGGGPGQVIGSAGLSSPGWLSATTIVAEDDSSATAPLVRIAPFSSTATKTAIAGTSGAILPSVRPGGSEVAFVLPSGPQGYDLLRVITLSTGAVRAVATPGSSYLDRASWTPDGSSLYFVAGDATTDVFAVGTGPGAVPRNVTSTPAELETSVAVSMPDTAAPTGVKLAGVPATTLASSVTPTFTASDATQGVGSYTLAYRYVPFNGSTWTQKSLVLTAPRAIAVARGYEYCFSVRATDRAGNTSAATPEQCVVVPLDDRAFVRSSAFAAVTGSAYYAGTAMRTTTKGATLTRSGVSGAKQLFLVALTCSTCGSVDVLVGTTRVAGVSLVSSTTTYRRVLALSAGIARSGTVTIRVTSTGKLVTIDGLAVKK